MKLKRMLCLLLSAVLTVQLSATALASSGSATIGGVVNNNPTDSHKFVNYVSDNNATCTQDGTKTAKCEYCDETDTVTDVGSATGHDFSGQWTVTKKATATEEGRRETLCQNGCGMKKVEVIPATGSAAEAPNAGTLEKDAEVSPDAPIESATLDNSKTELLNKAGIFTTAEQTAIKNGEDARVYLTIEGLDEEEIPDVEREEVKNAVIKALGSNAIIEYMDVSLFKKIGNAREQQIHSTKTAMEITMEIPSLMVNKNKSKVRKYRIIRIHNGKAETIYGTYNSKTNEFTFKTDKFSTYAIAYTDETTKLTVTPSSATLTKKGATVQLKSVVTPVSDADQTVSYTSSNTKIATVDKNGKVTAVSNGTAKITVKTPSGLSKTVTITVTLAETNALTLNSGLKVSQSSDDITVKWGKVKGADGYTVSAAYCGERFGKNVVEVKNGLLASAKITKLNGKKLNLKKNYKVYVTAYKLVDGKKVTIAKSITAHIVGAKNPKYSNVKKIKLTSKSSVTLKEGKTSDIKAKAVLVNSKRRQLSNAHAPTFRYTSSDTSVATVSSKGKITAKGKGTCYVYIYAKNGYAQKVKVTVK